MLANVYLVFNKEGHLLSTRLMTETNCWYRSVHRAAEIASESKQHIDIGSQEPCTVFTKRLISDAVQRFDDYTECTSVMVAQIDI